MQRRVTQGSSILAWRQPRRLERAYGRFERSLALPHEVDGTAAEVSVADGVVTVILPKKEALPPR